MRIARREPELMENVRNLISAYTRISILFGKPSPPPLKKKERDDTVTMHVKRSDLSCIRVSQTYRILFNFSIH